MLLKFLSIIILICSLLAVALPAGAQEGDSPNPTLTTGLILFAAGAAVLVGLFVFWFGRRRALQKTFNPPPEIQREIEDADAEAGAEGIILRATASPHFVSGKEWGYSLATVMREGLQIGSGAGTPGTVYLDLGDPGVSRLHATIGYEGGQYWIRDEGSTNGTYIDQQRLTSGQRYPLQSGQVIGFGLNTQIEFVTRLYREQPSSPSSDLLPANALPRGVSARITVIQSPDPTMYEGRTFEITTREFTIGRDPSNDLIINAEGVSKVHATLKFANRQFLIADQRSTNHTMLDGARLSPLEPAPLVANKEYVIMLGQKTHLRFSYQLDNPPEAEATDVVPVPGAPSASPSDGTVMFVADAALPAHVNAEIELLDRAGEVSAVQKVTSPEVTIGRKSTNKLVFDNPEVSRLHAHLFWREGRFYLEDLDSGNGTLLNGERLIRRHPVELTPKMIHEIRLGRESVAIRFRFHYDG